MAWFTRSSQFSLLAIALTLGLAMNTPLQAQTRLGSSPLSNQIPNQWEPPTTPTPAPINKDSGGRRGPCIADPNFNKAPIALVPPSGVGTTMAEYPTVFWYMPKTTAWGVEFRLSDANQNVVYSTTYAFAHYTEKTADGKDEGEFVVGAPGIMSLTLPASGGVSPLEMGKDYRWQLRLICDPQDITGDVYIEGGFKRVAVDPNLKTRIQQAKPEDLVTLYANQRLWYETIDTLIELRRDRPNDKNFTEAWNKLLRSVGLEIITEESLFEEARTVNN